MDLTFDIIEHRIADTPVVAVTGEIDVATAPDLREHLVALESTGAQAVVVDLTNVSFIDSTALGVLVGAFRRMRNAGGVLRLVVTEPRIIKVLEITELVRVFPIFSTVDEAVRG